MLRPSRARTRGIRTAAMLIVAAWLLRVATMLGAPHSAALLLLRESLYIALFCAWGVSVRQRIIQVQVRRYLLCASGLMLFWMGAHLLKFHLVRDPNLLRHLWYAYYIPLMFLPVVCVFVALSLGKPEDYRLPPWTKAMLLIAAAFALLVLTNDLHCAVFTFPPESIVWTDAAYTRVGGYYLVCAWAIFCTFATVAIIVRKARIPALRRRVAFPLAMMLLMVVYWALYSLDWPPLYFLFGDMTVVYCLIAIATFESCFYSGLIQSNTHYEDLFRACALRSVIVDEDYRTFLRSNNYKIIPSGIMRETENGPVMLEGNIRLSGAPIRGGHVLWKEDMTELVELVEELKQTQEDLQGETDLLQENYSTERALRHLAEQNRLYDEMHRQTAKQIERLGALLEQFRLSEDEEEKRRLLARMAVIGVYLKRRNNLIFVSEQSQLLQSEELALCLRETLDNLAFSGVDCASYVTFEGMLDAETVTMLYDFCEEVIEAAYDSLRSYLVRIYARDEKVYLTSDADCDVDLSPLCRENITLHRTEDGTQSITLCAAVGGEAK